MVAYLGIGSNLGDKKSNIDDAIRRINEINGISILKKSSVYETEPVGYMDQPDFLNSVIEIDTELDPVQLLHSTQQIEKDMGRVRNLKWGPRVIDIDILIFDNLKIDTTELVLPHPRITERAFVIIPLAEIAPDLIINNSVSVIELSRKLSDQAIRKVMN
ncbi:MAG: 2-amino-4-hydroxy-6-hydroxymethyldihydropteridine diphosphokinase [Armatimonadota bacterium]